jgi:HJR/Mrr/RecB family endonuclease
MARFDDPFFGRTDAYHELTRYDHLAKGAEISQSMKEALAALNDFGTLKGDLGLTSAASQAAAEYERTSSRLTQAQVVDLTQQVRDITKAARRGSLDQTGFGGDDPLVHSYLAQAIAAPVPTYLADWLSAEAAFYPSSKLEQIERSLGRLTSSSDIAFAARVVLRKDESTPHKSTTTEKQSSDKNEEAADEEINEPAEDYSELALPEDIRQRLQVVDFIPLEIHRRIARDQNELFNLSSRQFEEYIADLLRNMEFEDIILTPSSGDGGRDLIATKRHKNIPLIFAFECKRYAPKRGIGPQIMRALLGTVKGRYTAANVGVLVTTSYFTKGSKDLIISEPLLDGKDFDDLTTWIHEVSQKMKL